jgi:PTS system galactitol-specific IIA component
METTSTTVTETSVEGALRELGDHAVEQGYADPAYVEAVVDRESEYPTGLSIPNEAFGLAIPHADPDHVIEEALVLGLPAEPVPFRSMDDPETTVDAEAILLLLVGDTDGYTQFLSNLAALFGESAFTDHVRQGDAESVLSVVRERCL